MTHATTWINLETFVQSERSQTQKMPRIVQFSFPEISRIAKSIETKWLPRARGREKWKVTTTWYDFFVVSEKGLAWGLRWQRNRLQCRRPKFRP